jgi:hypothetical protein
MVSRSNQVQLTDEVARFEECVRSAATEIVQMIFRQELLNRLGELKRDLAASNTSRRTARARRPNSPRPSTKPKIVAAPPPPDDRETGRKRAWTRDKIVSELATWLVSGTTIDAAFVTRHGPPGLVAATRRVFGRFDAALNVASLHVSKMYPDGAPARR